MYDGVLAWISQDQQMLTTVLIWLFFAIRQNSPVKTIVDICRSTVGRICLSIRIQNVADISICDIEMFDRFWCATILSFICLILLSFI